MRDLFTACYMDAGTGVGAMPSFGGWEYIAKNVQCVVHGREKIYVEPLCKQMKAAADVCYSVNTTSTDPPPINIKKSDDQSLLFSFIASQRRNNIDIAKPKTANEVKNIIGMLQTIGRKSEVVSEQTLRYFGHVHKHSASFETHDVNVEMANSIFTSVTDPKYRGKADQCHIFNALPNQDTNISRLSYLVNNLYFDDVFSNNNVHDKATTPFFYGCSAALSFILAFDIFHNNKHVAPVDLAIITARLNNALSNRTHIEPVKFAELVKLKSESAFINDINFVYSEIAETRLSEQLSVRTSSNGVHCSGFQIHENGSGNVSSSGGLVEINVDSF